MREVPGSIPGTALLLRGPTQRGACSLEGRVGTGALLAQWLERAAVNRKVTGSIPVGSASLWRTVFGSPQIEIKSGIIGYIAQR